MTVPRTEYGLTRSTCACPICINNCRFIPGYLLLSDLDRLTPAGLDWAGQLAWAETHLRASEGARLLGQDGNVYQAPTLVPSHRPDMSCHWLGTDDRCQVHADAPFGCAFFSCEDSFAINPRRGMEGIVEVLGYWTNKDCHGLRYTMTWTYLHLKGLVPPPIRDRKEAARMAQRALAVLDR